MYAIGIDVSKGKSTIAINLNGILLEKPFEIKHTNKGFDMLLEKIKEFPKEAIKFVMEATGIYHLPILLKLLELKYFIAQMNELARELPEYDIVRKMKGVGNKICPRIIAEIGDVRKYKNANSLIASARIDTEEDLPRRDILKELISILNLSNEEIGIYIRTMVNKKDIH